MIICDVEDINLNPIGSFYDLSEARESFTSRYPYFNPNDVDHFIHGREINFNICPTVEYTGLISMDRWLERKMYLNVCDVIRYTKEHIGSIRTKQQIVKKWKIYVPGK